MEFEYKQFYRRKLPHRHSPGATIFVTYRLKGSIPKAVIDRWKSERIWLENEMVRLAQRAEASDLLTDKLQLQRITDLNRRHFAESEEILHIGAHGPHWLKDPLVAQIIVDSLHHLNNRSFCLHAFCVMSNHAHVVFTPLLNERTIKEIKGSNPLKFVSAEPTLPEIMKSLKGYTAWRANKLLGRSGAFWEEESYDHEVRNDQEYRRIIKYVLNNPVKAGLVDDWREWKWSWRAEE